MPLAVDDLNAFLAGDWRLRRRMVSSAPRQSGRAQGVAILRSGEDELDYEETVDVLYADHRGRASRRYRYRLRDRGCADVYFEDGRFFHDLDLRTGRWHVEHICGADVYRGAFRVLSETAWLVRWRVEGPRKNLRITTLYERRIPPED